jgi:Ca2+-binding RTX toxin-like protein
MNTTNSSGSSEFTNPLINFLLLTQNNQLQFSTFAEFEQALLSNQSTITTLSTIPKLDELARANASTASISLNSNLPDSLTGNTSHLPLVQPDFIDSDIDAVNETVTNASADWNSKTDSVKERAKTQSVSFYFSKHRHRSVKNLGTFETTVSEAIAQATADLKQFATDSNMMTKMRKVFGDDWTAKEGRKLMKRLASDDQSKTPLFNLEILSGSKLKAQGAFAAQTNTIYLSKQFLKRNAGNPDAVATVLLEEIGHYIDAQLNQSETPGDEGSLFAALVEGRNLSKQQRQMLKTGNDFGALTYKNKEIQIEKATFIGTTGNDSLLGTADNDLLEGREGNDLLDGKAGNDTLVGGIGNDSYHVDSAGDIVVEEVDGGYDSVYAYVDFSIATMNNVEVLYLWAANVVRGVGNALDNSLAGNAQNNILEGGAGNDGLSGYAGADTLIGGVGNDFYNADVMDLIVEEANEGIDTIRIATDFSLVDLPNIENLMLDPSAILGIGNALNNSLHGNMQDNILEGGAGNDTLNGSGGVDTLIGGTGNDSYSYIDATDVIVEEENGGIDWIVATSDFSLANLPNVENLALATIVDGVRATGNALNNNVQGHAMSDILVGGAGNDTLNGGAGADTLEGGEGNDILRGSLGNDILVVDSGADQLWGDAGSDAFTLSKLNPASVTIQDFSAAESDSIQIGLGNSALQLQASQLRSGAGVNTATTLDQRVLYNTSTGELFYDADGSGTQFSPVGIATLSNKAALSAANIYLVEPPSLTLALKQDTAPGTTTNTDRITADPTLTGYLANSGQSVELAVGFNPDQSLFKTISSVVNADGSFTLDKAQLAAVNGGSLPDGTYTLYLKAKDNFGNWSNVINTVFTLDTQAPVQSITSLIDGISWKEGEQLKGKVSNFDSGSFVTYRFDDQGETMLSLDTAGAFDQLLDLPDSFGSHRLQVSSIDAAGNRQVAEFKFLVKENKSVLDDDQLAVTPPPSGGGGSGGSGSSSGSSWLASGGSGGSWGYGGSVGSNDPLADGNPDGYTVGEGYGEEPLPYLEKVAIILDQATGSIGTTPQNIHKQAALKNRTALLMEIADMVDQGKFYDRMESVLHGIYDQANNDPVSTRSDAWTEGDYLAGDIRDGSEAVKVQVYQAALLAVVNQVLIDHQFTPQNGVVYQQMVDALLQLGRSYAVLNPTEAANASGTPDFLDSLWRAQKTLNPYEAKPLGVIRQELQQGMTALYTLLDGVDNPLQALKFVNNLLQAATNVESLDAEAIYDAEFLRELVAFGFEYAKLNPTQLEGAETDGLNAFLATLWQGESGDSLAMRKATGKFSDLFNGLDSKEEHKKLIKFETNLLKAIGLGGQELLEEKQDSKFLSALVQLGGAYAALNPITNSAEPVDFFLDTLWSAQDETGFQKGIGELLTFTQDFDNLTQLIDYQSKLLTAIKLVSSITQAETDPVFIKELSNLSSYYALLQTVNGEANNSGSFLAGVWKAKTQQDLKEVADGYQFLMDYVVTSAPTQIEQFDVSSFHTQVIKLARQTIIDEDVRSWSIVEFGLWQAGILELNEFRNQWIYGYRNVINYAAQLFDIPPILLAAIAHMEVAGDPYILDSLAYTQRVLIPGEVPPEQTSFGPLSIQVGTAIDTLRYESSYEDLSPQQVTLVIQSLHDPRQNIFIAAAHLSDLRNFYFLGKEAYELTEENLMTVAGAYNAGTLPYDQLWAEGYAGGYGREAIQNRVRENQLNRILNGEYPNE